MTPVDLIVVAAAGTAAGAINTVVGSGTLVTFPALLAVGLPPVTANVANNIGLAPGSLSGAVAYRHSLHAPRSTILTLAVCACSGGIVGALLLLTLPSRVFHYVAPALIAVAIALVIAQPWLQRRFRTHAHSSSSTNYGGLKVAISVVATSAYGGYFGAGQGVILLALMAVLIPQGLQRINALKNVLQGVDNLTSATVFILLYNVRWDAVAVLAISSMIGGFLGGHIGQRLPDRLLRGFIIVIGVFGIVYLLA